MRHPWHVQDAGSPLMILAALLACLLLLSGCAPKATMRHQGAGKPLAVKQPGEAMVYGRFVMTADGVTIPFKKGLWPVVDLRFFHTETGMWTDPIFIEEDGSFYVVLNKGIHILSGLTGLVNQTLFSPERKPVDPHAMLELDPAAESSIFYAGTITITVDNSEVESINVTSEAKEATVALLKRNPDIKLAQVPAVAMLYHDPSIIAPPLKAPPDPEREKKMTVLRAIGSISLEVVKGMGAAGAFAGGF